MDNLAIIGSPELKCTALWQNPNEASVKIRPDLTWRGVIRRKAGKTFLDLLQPVLVTHSCQARPGGRLRHQPFQKRTFRQQLHAFFPTHDCTSPALSINHSRASASRA